MELSERPALGDLRHDNGRGTREQPIAATHVWIRDTWCTIPTHPDVFVVFEKHRSGVQGVASVHVTLAGAKSSQEPSGAVFEPIEGVPGHWFATILEGRVELHINRTVLKP